MTAEIQIQITLFTLNVTYFTSPYVKIVLVLSTPGMLLSTKRNFGLQVNLAFLSSTTLVVMLAVRMTRLAASETEQEKQTLVFIMFKEYGFGYLVLGYLIHYWGLIARALVLCNNDRGTHHFQA